MYHVRCFKISFNILSSYQIWSLSGRLINTSIITAGLTLHKKLQQSTRHIYHTRDVYWILQMNQQSAVHHHPLPELAVHPPTSELHSERPGVHKGQNVIIDIILKNKS